MTDTYDEWSHGYITDVKYTYGFYRELSPVYLNYAVLLAGYRPCRLDRGFTYCELGAGNGLSGNLHAAANPRGEFYAVDFNPTHIADARSLAEAAGLKNVNFLEKSFDQLPSENLPKFDFICLHGVFSWINAENRDAIVRFINDRLKPGGIVYVSYNCLPGRASSIPIRQLLTLYAEQMPGNTMSKVSGAVASVKKAYEVGGGYFESAPAVRKTLDMIVKHEERNRNYLAHEYFNRDWHPLFFSEVSREMSQAKLTFVTSANLFENNLSACLKDKPREIVMSAPTVELRETLKDFYINQSFRRDIYMRGVPRLTPRERMETLMGTTFVLQADRKTFKKSIKTSFGEIAYKKEEFDPVLDELEKGPKTLEELAQAGNTSSKTAENLIQVMSFWAANSQISPALTETDREPSDRMNRAILTYSKYGETLQYLACPTTGSGMYVSWLNLLFVMGLEECKEEDKIPEFILSVLKDLGRSMIKDGKPVTGDKENLEELNNAWQEFNEKYRQQLERMNLL
ncbi:MAG: methyltransferase domain-containing protein [Desulfobacterales bacterium]|nr:methyltransferase domain-containing protein [Desulfobacterales bacterium]